jgi:hypothetical protein
MLETMVRKGFLSMDNYNLLLIDSNPERLLKKMEEFKPKPLPKWLNEDRA